MRAGVKRLDDCGGYRHSAVLGNRELDLDAVNENLHDRVGVENELKVTIRPLLSLALKDKVLRGQRCESGDGGGSGLGLLCGLGVGSGNSVLSTVFDLNAVDDKGLAALVDKLDALGNITDCVTVLGQADYLDSPVICQSIV